MKVRKRTGCLVIFLGLVAVATFPFLWKNWVFRQYTPHIYSVDTVRPERVAVVFGAAVYANGRLSPMLRDRVETAIRLYEEGKVERLLMSGDNSEDHYNEPGRMMEYAIARGVPAAAIQPDYGGRRTYDTCYRARHIFQVESAILVTQAFHLPRALYTCEQLGVAATGVSADRRRYHPRSLAWSENREVAALVRALVDTLRHRPAPVMGEPIPIRLPFLVGR